MPTLTTIHNEDCAICMNTLVEEQTTVLSCAHKMCTTCLMEWRKRKEGHMFCPICRTEDHNLLVSDDNEEKKSLAEIVFDRTKF